MKKIGDTTKVVRETKHTAGRTWVTGRRYQTIVGAAVGAILASTASGQERVGATLEEVVVTATRREESVLDIPINISVTTGEDLNRLAVRDITGIAAHVPGLVVTDNGVRSNGTNNSFIIRGINAGGVGGGGFQDLISASVSTYVDETPMFANLRLTDIARVEVLRGPQGTLYGASSVGGTIRLIQNLPNTSETEFRVAAEGGTLAHSDDLDYRADVVVNLPISDRFAVRMSGGFEKLAGFIDARNSVVVDQNMVPVLANPADPVRSGFLTERIEDLDSSETWFVRGAALYDFSESTRLVLSYQHQEEKAGGFSSQQLSTRDYTMGRRQAREPSDRTTDLAAATVTVDLGFATLTSATGFFESSESSQTDGSLFPIIFAAYYGNYPRITLPTFNEFENRSLSQEFRLVSQGEGPWNWTVGAYYQDAELNYDTLQLLKGIADWSELQGTGGRRFRNFGDAQQAFGLLRPSQIQPKDMATRYARRVSFEDKALFGEVTYNINDAWSVKAGVRAFRQENSQDLLAELPYFGPLVASDGNIFGRNRDIVSGSFSDQVFKLNTSYKLSEDTLLYLTAAEGFRAGGANSYPVGTCLFCDPATFLSYAPDTATNYELGIKGRLSDSLQYTLAAYRIDWEDIQFETAASATTAIIVNGGEARSQGLELEVAWAAGVNTMLTAGYSYTDAELTQDVLLPVGGQLAPGAGFKGDRLPGVSEHQFSTSFDQRWPIGGERAILLHLDAAYRGDFPNRLSTRAANYRIFDGFWVVNAFVGVELSEKMQVQLYARNLTDEQGISAYALPNLVGPSGTPGPEFASESMRRPRTMGLRVTWQF
jgi:outer membrane receptor protein involved in Fe transport